MEECLTKRSVETKRDYVLKPLSATEGAHARDALCKAIYGRMFSWIVGKINSSIKVLGKGHTFLCRAGWGLDM